MAARVLRELEELRSMLAQPTPSLSGSPVAAAVTSISHLSPLLLPSISTAQTPGYSTYSFHTPLSASPGAAYAPAAPLTGGSAAYAATAAGAGGLPYSGSVLGSYAATTAAAAAAAVAAVPPSYGAPTRSSPTTFSSKAATDGSSRTAERLGRALEAAEEEMDAAMARQADIINSQLRAREIDVAEAQRVAAAAQAEVSVLRSQLAAAKQAAAAEAAGAEARMAAKEGELSAAQAELLALRAEADDLKQRLADGHLALNRADAALSLHSNDLSRRLQAAAADAEAAAAAAAWEREQKESVLVQLSGCQSELAAAQDQLAVTAQELRHTQRQAALEAESRHQLGSALQRTAAAAATLKDAKDLEINELRQRLKAEHNVRKACEAWLRSELKSRGEMEALLQAVRDMAGSTANKPAAAAATPAGAVADSSSSGSCGSNKAAAAAMAAADVARVESLLAQLCDEQVQQQQQQQQQRQKPQQQQQTLQQRQQPQKQQQQQQHRPVALSWHADGTAAPPAAAAAGSIDRLMEGEAQANKARKDFVKMKAALCDDSRRLKAELETAKQMLRSRLAARKSSGAATTTTTAAAAADGSCQTN